MSELPAAQQQALAHWASDAITAGWLPETTLDNLQDAVVAAPSHLFKTESRPLVVGLFGGTGVGKSTLLNRFAGEAIARASAERPTSRDITVYVHRSISVDNLPDNFPMHKMRTSLHGNEHYKHVMFIDMPDFDSVESANRDLVDAWLPHLDVVVYVVSPDRYRDDQGWRLLLTHATQHAWLFVMNHWDRGEAQQLEDFRSQLAGAGLADPMVFHTDSSAQPLAGADQFDALQQVIQDTADHSVIKKLADIGVVARLKSLKVLSEPWLSNLGAEDTFASLDSSWSSHWQKHSRTIEDSMAFKFSQFAEQFAEPKGSWLKRFRSDNATATKKTSADTLIDSAVLSQLDNGLADFINQQSQSLSLPVAAIKQAVGEPYARARRDVGSTVSSHVEKSLALPGNALQRGLHKTLGVLSVLLPLAAMGWIAYRVVFAFAEGGSNPAAYLGSNFAVNGGLLLALSWLLPTFLSSKTRPSQVRAAQRGLTLGLQAALKNIEDTTSSAFSALSSDSKERRSSYNLLWQTLATTDAENLPEPVKRMLASEVSGVSHRELDVRANTHTSTDSAPES